MVGGVAESNSAVGGSSTAVVPGAKDMAGRRVGCMLVGLRRDSGLGRIVVVGGMGFGLEEDTGSVPAGTAIDRRSCSILGRTLFTRFVSVADH